jgi:pimeloyl-ACP methyl ester carboxylesterase
MELFCQRNAGLLLQSSPLLQKHNFLFTWLVGSFYHLAPALAASGTHQGVALDLPGHRWSLHKPKYATPMVQAEMPYYVSEAIHALDHVENITLIGHLLGAGIANLYTVAFPKQIQQGLFESISPTDCCMLLANKGWPFDPYQMERTKNLLNPVVFHSLPVWSLLSPISFDSGCINGYCTRVFVSKYGDRQVIL